VRSPTVCSAEIRRFNREAAQIFARPDAQRLTLGDFLDERGYTENFRQFYLLPMVSAVWSCAPSLMKGFPAEMLIRFFDNHGLLTVNDHPRWKTIPGGCSRYIAPITAPYRQRITTGVEIRSVARDELGVTLRFAGERPDLRFDHVVFATNGDRVLPLLEDPSDAEREILQEFKTSRNDVVTLNANGHIRSDKGLRRFVYHHPLYTLDALRAQER
jgi:predicted NAD/FAD-binding protein